MNVPRRPKFGSQKHDEYTTRRSQDNGKTGVLAGYKRQVTLGLTPYRDVILGLHHFANARNLMYRDLLVKYEVEE